MFSYYGAKTRIIQHYEAPLHSTVIEPFAGSARYALKYWERDVRLYDLSDHVIQVWEYLIQASENDILSLPDVPSKVSLDGYTQLSEAERYLIGFHLCRGKAKPRKVGHGQNSWDRDKIRIAGELYKIRHWKIQKACFCSIPNIEATWFVDAPYQQTMAGPNKSDRYSHWAVDYELLAFWCESRKGQVIVCEGDGADWLPFNLLTKSHSNTNNRQTKEVGEYVWTSSRPAYLDRLRSELNRPIMESCK